MTTVCFLSSDLSILWGPIDGFLSLVWEERYTECGSYTLVLPMTKELFEASRAAEYIAVSDRVGLGRVEKLHFTTDCDTKDTNALTGVQGESSGSVRSGTLTLSGRMAESILSDRVITRGTRVSGELLAVLEDVLCANAVGSGSGARRIDRLVLGESAALTDGDGNSYTLDDAPGGRALDEWIRAMLEVAEASYRILPDYDTGNLVFSVYRGLDRTGGQRENGICIFSTSFASIGALEFLSDRTEYKNFAYIAGEGEGANRVTVTLDLRSDADEPLRELYVDARDLRSDDGGSVMSAAAYRNALLARGRERLKQHNFTMRLRGETPAMPESEAMQLPMDTLPPVGSLYAPLLQAGEDYALGDLCDIAGDTLGMAWSQRITEIVYTYEGTRCLVEPRFGDGYPDLKTYIRRVASVSF